MKINQSKISGVLRPKQSEPNYVLRRYFPDDPLCELIEQFWFVSWDLGVDQTHIQQNLPDPNCHLVVDGKEVKVLGPVSKAYQYKMTGRGEILGVKFALGGLSRQMDMPITSLVDKSIGIEKLFDTDAERLLALLSHAKNDEQIVEVFQKVLKPYCFYPSKPLLKVREMVNTIKHSVNIYTVEQLSSHFHMSVRAVQRGFQDYIGLSPKWVIRKYRLHQALALLEDDKADINDLVAKLDYTDQPHLIRDFKDMLGVTPKSYMVSTK